MGRRQITALLLGIALAGALLGAPPAPPALAAGPPATDQTAAAPEDPGHALDDDVVLPPGSEGHARSRYQKYPGRRIRYWVDAPARFRWAISRGAKAWNDTGLDITFVETGKKRAQLTIRTVKDLGGALGQAVLGYSRDPRWRWVKLDVDQLSPRDVWQGFTRAEREVFTAAVVAHELGHTLGLDHAGGQCAILHPIIYGGTCPFFADRVGHYNCRLVDRLSLSRARRLYGGKRTLGPRSCPMHPLPPRLAGVEVTGGGPDGEPAVVGWTRPRGKLPAGSRIAVLVRRSDSCDFSPRAPRNRMATYPSGVEVHLLKPSARSLEVAATRDEQEVCIGAGLVNRTGGGRGLGTGKATLYTPQPPPEDRTTR